MAAARQRLRENGWTHGFGIHRDGQAIWNGSDGAFANAFAPVEDPMVLADHGHSHDPAGHMASDADRARHHRVTRGMQWNLLSPRMERVIRDLREGRPSAPPPGAGKAPS